MTLRPTRLGIINYNTYYTRTAIRNSFFFYSVEIQESRVFRKKHNDMRCVIVGPMVLQARWSTWAAFGTVRWSDDELMTSQKYDNIILRLVRILIRYGLFCIIIIIIIRTIIALCIIFYYTGTVINMILIYRWVHNKHTEAAAIQFFRALTINGE